MGNINVNLRKSDRSLCNAEIATTLANFDQGYEPKLPTNTTT